MKNAFLSASTVVYSYITKKGFGLGLSLEMQSLGLEH